MKNILLLVIAVMFCTIAHAQSTYKINKKSGTLVLVNMNAVQIDSHVGDQVEITAKVEDQDVDERAVGLRPINDGLLDNSGIGIHVKELENGETELTRVNPFVGKKIYIKIPQNVHISIRNRGILHDEDNLGIVIKNVNTEINAVMQYGDIKLENITGPSNVSNIYGNIEANINKNVKGPFSLVTVYGFVDMSIPKITKADLNMSTNYGNILVSDQLDIVVDKTQATQPSKPIPPPKIKKEITIKHNMEHESHVNMLDSMQINWDEISEQVSKAISSIPQLNIENMVGKKISGKLNGGGTPVILKSNYGKIYFRDVK